MYSFKSLIHNCLDDFMDKKDEVASIISFYSAFAVALAIKDIREKTDSSAVAEKRNNLIRDYLKDPSIKNKTRFLNQLNKDRRLIDEILGGIKEDQTDFAYLEENIDLKFVEGCVGTVIEGYS